MKKIIVTGGSGFIGTNLVNFLVKKNFFVINIDKLTYSSNNSNHRNKSKNYKFIKSDINDLEKIKNIINSYNPKAIFNLAAETHVDRSIDSPKDFISSNILGVYNLLEALKYFKKRNKIIKLIHVSTDEVYGDILHGRASEKFSYQPSSPYSASKASADHLIKSYIRTYKISAIISNCSNNYGPYQFPEKLIPKIISNILVNKPIPIYGKGKNSREWIYVNDHCEALFKLYLKGKIGQSYNIGSNNNLNNIKLVKKILKIVKMKRFKLGNKTKITFVKDRPGHDFRYALNNKKIQRELGWKPRTNLDKGLNLTIDWYLKNRKFLNSISKKFYSKRIGLNI